MTRGRPHVPRARAALAIGLVLGVAGAVAWWRADPWPPRAVLHVPKDHWPLAFSPDGRALLVSGPGGITPWDVATARPGPTWPGGRRAQTGLHSPDGRTFVAVFVEPDGASLEWVDAATGRTRFQSTTAYPSIYQLAFTPDGRALRGVLGDGPRLKAVVTWDAATGREESYRPLDVATYGGDTAFAPDGRALAVSPMGSRAVRLWDLDAGRPLGTLNNPSTASPARWGGVGFSPDGRTLAIGREDGTIELWDVEARRLRSTLRGHSGGYASGRVRFSPDGRTLASTGKPHGTTSAIGRAFGALANAAGLGRTGRSEVVVLDLATGRRLARATTSIHPIYSPDGRSVATREPGLDVLIRDIPGR